jgi:hypothetical protein
MLARKCRKYFKTFVGWGGLSGAAAYVIQGELANALLIALIIGLVVFLDDYYS